MFRTQLKFCLEPLNNEYVHQSAINPCQENNKQVLNQVNMVKGH